MKLLRLWLLVLMAVLVPVRGAVAAVGACPGHAPGPASAMATGLPVHPGAPHGAHHGALHAHAMSAAGQAGPDAHGLHHEGADKCALGGACCAAAPLMPACLPTLPTLELPAGEFPPAATMALAFLSEGPERPPRSL